ncbi:MAG: PilZ domain-containing protein [Alphaproteobacteria bacterium]
MLKKALISTLLLFGLISAPATAQTACGSLDQILETVSVVRDIQVDKRDRNFPKNIRKLSTLSETISLASIAPPVQDGLLSVDMENMFRYLSTVRESVAGAHSGYDEYAKNSLNNGITPELAASLQLLAEYWDCRPETEGAENDLSGSDEKARRSQKQALEVKAKAENSRKAGTKELVSTERSNSGVLEKMRLDGGVIFKGDMLVLMLALAFLGTALLIYYIQKRAKTFRERDARSLLNKSVKARLGKAEFEMFIVDISMNGAKIQHPTVIDKQRKIAIFLNGRWHAGQIKWFNTLYAGVKFKKPIDTQTVSSALNS